MSPVNSLTRRLIRKDWPLCCSAVLGPLLNYLYQNLTPGQVIFTSLIILAYYYPPAESDQDSSSQEGFITVFQVKHSSLITKSMDFFYYLFVLCQHSRDGERYSTCMGMPGMFCRWAGGVGAVSHHTHTHSKASEILLHLHPVSLLPTAHEAWIQHTIKVTGVQCFFGPHWYSVYWHH